MNKGPLNSAGDDMTTEEAEEDMQMLKVHVL